MKDGFDGAEVVTTGSGGAKRRGPRTTIKVGGREICKKRNLKQHKL